MIWLILFYFDLEKFRASESIKITNVYSWMVSFPVDQQQVQRLKTFPSDDTVIVIINLIRRKSMWFLFYLPIIDFVFSIRRMRTFQRAAQVTTTYELILCFGGRFRV